MRIETEIGVNQKFPFFSIQPANLGGVEVDDLIQPFPSARLFRERVLEVEKELISKRPKPRVHDEKRESRALIRGELPRRK